MEITKDYTAEELGGHPQDQVIVLGALRVLINEILSGRGADMNPDEKASVPSQASTAANEATRLPCRGCRPDCRNYDSCNGTPWRAQPGASDE